MRRRFWYTSNSFILSLYISIFLFLPLSFQTAGFIVDKFVFSFKCDLFTKILVKMTETFSMPSRSLALYVKSNKIHITRHRGPNTVLCTRVTLLNERTLITLSVNLAIPRYRSDFRSSRDLVASTFA